MIKQFSRLTRFEEKRAYRRIFLTILITTIIIVSFIFIGVPSLIKLSIFISNLKGASTKPAQQQNLLFPPHLEAAYTATNSAQIAINGYSQSGTTLEVFMNNQSLKKILIPNDGQFKLPDIILAEGENKITALIRDENGNISKPSQPLTIIYKKTLPKLEISEPSDGQNFTGENNRAQVIGLTEMGNLVTVNNRQVLIKNDATFIYPLSLNQGENLIKIVATDIAGNQTTVERKVIFTQ